MLETLRTLFRARQAEREEALIDANALTLLAQHLRDAKVDAGRARHALAGLIARRGAEQKRIGALDSDIARREEDARAAIDAGEDGLLEEIADHIAVLEDERARAISAENELLTRITALRKNLAEAGKRITVLADELRLARSQSMHRSARETVDGVASDCALRKAEETAKRLKSTGAIIDGEIAAMINLTESDGMDLDARVRDAGLDTRSRNRRAAILDRIRTEKTS